MGDIQPCAGQDNCPEDENFHFNTNVVFDRDGTLLVRYYKEYLFYDFGMNLPQKQQDPVFKTDFGTFATFICFDIEYEKMSEVSEREDVDAIVFSAMWGNTPPQRSSVQQWESWSLGNNATLLASNIQMPGYLATGSGIFSGTYGPLAYTFDPDGISKLIIARVPKRGNSFNFSSPNASIIKITMNDTHESLDDGSSVPTECSMKILGKAKDLYKDNRCFEMNMSNYSFVQLVEDSDHVKACLNGICCSLNYSSNGMTENFYLIVYNGTIDYASRYSFCEQTCMLTRCEAHGRNPCATFPLKSQTLFYNVQITADFSTKHIYPSVVSSGMRLTPLNEWSYGVHQRFSDAYEGYIDFKSSSGQALTSAVLRGRCYDRDPPYFP
ncbi:Biotinidase, partial [Stegodyphus mimosarum]